MHLSGLIITYFIINFIRVKPCYCYFYYILYVYIFWNEFEFCAKNGLESEGSNIQYFNLIIITIENFIEGYSQAIFACENQIIFFPFSLKFVYFLKFKFYTLFKDLKKWKGRQNTFRWKYLNNI